MIVEDPAKIRYDHQSVEKRWQTAWNALKLDVVDLVKSKNPYYNLMMFPYPSAEGLHVGNMYAFTGSDIHGRFMRMKGYDVFEPIGLDGFGIHSENYALKVGINPHEHARKTEVHFYDQLKAIGAMFSWDQTLETYDPSYYRWTQWLFTEMFRHGLAYRKKASVNYCPSCKTVLADEQVINTACERCGNTVEKRALEQWFFKITAYAEKLLSNTSVIKWSEKVKTAQINWIGKKQGITISYPLYADKKIGEITCFTTRPDTNFGATFVVMAPEHEMVAKLEKVVSPDVWKGIQTYVHESTQKTEMERIAEGRKKTGIATGLYCLNQLNNIKMPLCISDFVLKNFGTGVVVGVPGHDVRDFEFAQSFNLPIVRVVTGENNDRSDIKHIEQVQEDAGNMMNSGFLDGMEIHEAMEKMMDYLEEKGWGKRTSTYHIRDWLISRQRYWGPPIPMIYCEHCAKEGKSWFITEEAEASEARNSKHEARNKSKNQNSNDQNHFGFRYSNFEFSTTMVGWYPVPEDQLPVLLPEIEDYKPGTDGVAPLAKHKEFYEVACPHCGRQARRETDVSDTFLDSSWYFLRYPSIGSTTESTKPFDPELTKTWLPVSMYTGGAEHSVLHLLYSRFVWMCLHDWGHFDFSTQGGLASGWDEPFPNFFAHGLVIKDGVKMSKSKGNIVNPDEYIAKYGADALRLYLMFMGPFSEGGDFRDTGMEGMVRWLGKVWRLIEKSAKLSSEAITDEQKSHIYKELQKTVAKVSDDMPKRRYNTAIAGLMEFINTVIDEGGKMPSDYARIFLQLLAPFAPFITEELWQKLHDRETLSNKKDSIHFSAWPVGDKDALKSELMSFVIQVNGKVREVLSVSPEDGKTESKMIEQARSSSKISALIANQSIRKTIFVSGKLINFVI